MKQFRWAGAALLIFTAGTIFAARPLAVDDAGIVDVGQFEVEIGVAIVHDSVCDALEIPVGLTIGVLPNIAVGIGCTDGGCCGGVEFARRRCTGFYRDDRSHRGFRRVR